jgi:hypothetical protein
MEEVDWLCRFFIEMLYYYNENQGILWLMVRLKTLLSRLQ